MASVLTPQKDFRRAEKTLIRRRAHELSNERYEQYIEEMTKALKAGALKIDDIGAWRPAVKPQ